MQCMFPRVRYQCQLKVCCVSLDKKESGLTSRSDHPAGIFQCPYQSVSASLINQKDGGSFILASLTNRSHQLNSIIMFSPYFSVVEYNDTR